MGSNNSTGRFKQYANMGGCQSSDEKESKPPQDKNDTTKVKGAHRGRFSSVYDDAPEPVQSKVAAAQNRLKNIFGKGVEVSDDFVPVKYPKTPEEEAIILNATSHSMLFEGLDSKVRQVLVDVMEPFSAPAGSMVIKQGDIGDYFYVIEKGFITFVVDHVEVGNACDGASFGELALLYDDPRAATCIADDGGCKLWRLSQDMFKKVLANHNRNEDTQVIDVLRGVPLLADLDIYTLRKIASARREEEYKAGETIMKKGDVGDKFYIIKSGTVKLTDIGSARSSYSDISITKNDFFGERALLKKEGRAANATAETDCVFFTLTADQFHELLGSVESLMTNSLNKKKLLEIELLAKSKPSEEELNRLVNDHLKHCTYPKGTIIGTEGETVTSAIYLINEGEIKFLKNGVETATLKAPDYFGHETLGEKQVTLEHTIISLGAKDDKPASCYVLKSTDMKRSGLSRLGKTTRNKKFVSRISMADFNSVRDPTLKIEDLQKKKILGAGTFGKVWLCKNKKTGDALALKVQRKKDIINYKQVNGVIREKDVMMSIEHPFIIQMVNAFQDDQNLYMALKMYPGGELFSILHANASNRLPEATAKFYAATILEAMDFMHLKNILYRDLKPENVLIDEDGYCVLVDLGFAKYVEEKTYTLCGTPLYIAPEVILSRGHDKGADLWSFAVLTYEMVYGSTPFYKDGMEQMDLFKAVVKANLKFPSRPVAPAVSDLVKKILQTRSSYRLGCLKNGAQDIRDHRWFKGLDFDLLVAKNLDAPWKPKLKNPFDTRNFDDWSHLEREKPKKTKLLSKEQALFKDF